jgi:hypothetical protein
MQRWNIVELATTHFSAYLKNMNLMPHFSAYKKTISFSSKLTRQHQISKSRTASTVIFRQHTSWELGLLIFLLDMDDVVLQSLFFLYIRANKMIQSSTHDMTPIISSSSSG